MKRKGSKPKFCLGQVVVGAYSDNYINRIKAITVVVSKRVYRTADGNDWDEDDLRPLKRIEIGALISRKRKQEASRATK